MSCSSIFVPPSVMLAALHAAHRPRLSAGDHRHRSGDVSRQRQRQPAREGRQGRRLEHSSARRSRASAISIRVRRRPRRRSADATKTVDAPYNAAASTGSNLGPITQKLLDRVQGRRRRAAQATGVERTDPGRCGDRPRRSGLDPAYLARQTRCCRSRASPRRAASRKTGCARWLRRHVEGRALGLLGEPRVNVLPLNLALDALKLDRTRRGTTLNDMPAGRPNEPRRTRCSRSPSRSGRGRLKIFLGAAPGVGKTYAMLSGGARAPRPRAAMSSSASSRRTGARETEALLDGLEVLPRKPIIYVNRILSEFDIDAALARKPEPAARRRARPHQHPRQPPSQALAGRRGAARRRHRRLDHAQRPAPRKPQRRGRADHRRARCARPCPTRVRGRRRDRAGRPAARRAAQAPRRGQGLRSRTRRDARARAISSSPAI